MERTGTSLPDSLTERSNVLVLAPTASCHDDALCVELLASQDSPPDAVLSITLSQSVDERLSIWERYADSCPSEIVVVSSDEATRSTTADHTDCSHCSSVIATPRSRRPPARDESNQYQSLTVCPDSNTEVTVDPVFAPGDLAGIGMGVTEHLSRLRPEVESLSACFHSLSCLLQHAEVKPVYQFCQVLTNQLAQADARAHYHLDPNASDEQAVATLEPLFDAVVAVEEDGTSTVHRP